MSSSILTKVRSEYKPLANPAKAAQMQRYMKSVMPYWGLPAPLYRKVCKLLFQTYDFTQPTLWQQDILTLWREACYREERYAALALAGHRKAKKLQTLDTLPMYEEMIVTGAWWDYVDDIACHRLSEILQNQPAPMKKAMLAWSQDENLWKRRSAILCQIPCKEKTDLDLLYRCIEPSLSSKEFFLRKAIGWALRQYAWTDADEIKHYVEKKASGLSPLSKREALKNISTD